MTGLSWSRVNLGVQTSSMSSGSGSATADRQNDRTGSDWQGFTGRAPILTLGEAGDGGGIRERFRDAPRAWQPFQPAEAVHADVRGQQCGQVGCQVVGGRGFAA
ncbi:hypothetical protein GCM10010345_69700 [Streptomyces canarius]|uniref:Uncharacterized protein n=1 Tax=Streptomyces canarius TaxID=285453 RepID=A0ABQ3D564_9ACTN|nr:hypothetical protein GCM10010345_69700 [Streptomyces canarius]